MYQKALDYSGTIIAALPDGGWSPDFQGPSHLKETGK